VDSVFLECVVHGRQRATTPNRQIVARFSTFCKIRTYTMTEREILKTVLENIQTKLSPQIFEAYFAELQVLSIGDHQMTIACKNAFTKQTIEGRYYTTLLNTVKNVLSTDNVELNLIIKAFKSESQQPGLNSLFSTPPAVYIPQTPPETAINTAKDLARAKAQESLLNPKYTFESFIVGSGNQLPHAAAQAIADNPGNVYNPFFIYGNVGLGKTHIMQAIGNEVLKANTNAKVLYCTTETFLNEMVASIRTQKTGQFRDKYRALDVLILDDIQFISNKEALQEEFFNTFNSLYQAGKQIVIASDRPPGEIAHLEDRIRSRFEGGLVADMKSPNVETRAAILQKKLIERNEFLPETLVYAIAECVDTNIRELEGALLKVTIHYKTSGNLSVSDVKTILGDKMIQRKKKINPLDLMRVVCEQMQIELKDIKSSKRNYDISYARQLCMFLLKDILKLQLVKIAKHVGRKDHTTVMHGISKIEQMVQDDKEAAQLVSELRSKILALQ
jgi:chromosomal replication initiator protein